VKDGDNKHHHRLVELSTTVSSKASHVGGRIPQNGIKWSRSFSEAIKGSTSFRRRSRDQGGHRATISTIKYFSWLITIIIPYSDSQTSGQSIVSFPDHFSPHSGANNGLGMRLVWAQDFSRPRLPHHLCLRAPPKTPPWPARAGSLTGARICTQTPSSGFTNHNNQSLFSSNLEAVWHGYFVTRKSHNSRFHYGILP